MTDEMTPERLAEIKARADAATTGPWVRGLGGNSVHAGDNGETVCEIPDRRARTEDGRRPASMLSNAKFIAHARTDVPALIAEVERLREALHDAEQAAAVEASARREFKARATAAEAKLAEAERRIERLLLTQRRLFEGAHVRLLEEAEAHNAQLRADLDWYIQRVGSKESTP